MKLTPALGLLGLLAACGADAPPPPTGPTPAKSDMPSTTPPAAASAAPSTPQAASIATVTERFNANDANGLFAMFSDDMKKAFPLEKIGPILTSLREKYGKMLGNTRVPGSDDFRCKTDKGEMMVTLSVNPQGKIDGIRFFDPPVPAPDVVKTPLLIGLPFKGQWHVFWGGDTQAANGPHLKAGGSQRRAADLDGVDASGKDHKGEGKKNEDYFGYGREVLSVANGTVLEAVDGVPENVPGTLNPAKLAGNHVIVEHPGNIFSFYAHLQPGKLKVKAGAKVSRGDVLGLCGNSGNSSQPHLHFQVQDGPSFEKSFGMEPVFANVSFTRDGKTSVVAEYTWLKGDLVSGKH